MAFQFNLSGHTPSKDVEARVVTILHFAKEEIAKIAPEVFGTLNTDHYGYGSTTAVKEKIDEQAKQAATPAVETSS